MQDKNGGARRKSLKKNRNNAKVQYKEKYKILILAKAPLSFIHILIII